jgi:hypothetical protein
MNLPSRLICFATFAAAVAAAHLAHPVAAEEGMWPVNNFPADAVERAYGFRATPEWLDKVQRSAVRIAGGCSAAFVSPQGLVQTNHHCARGCIQALSKPDRDFVKNGFNAAAQDDETRCPATEINQLIAITDVTATVKDALRDKEGAAFEAARKDVEARLTKDCSEGKDTLRCDVVELYQGGIYNLYKYRRYQDVRLVFAPEEGIAFFGGDPDNFEFPRYNLDVTYYRVYEDGKPLDTSANYFPYAPTDAREGDLVFTAGNPGSTNRLNTVAELEYARDMVLPNGLFRDSELRGLLTEYTRRGPEEARTARGLLFGIENSLKGRKGRFRTLMDPSFMRERRRAERSLRQEASDKTPWQRIASVMARLRSSPDLVYVSSFQSRLFSYALDAVRRPVEQAKPEGERLPEYTTAKLPALRQSLLSTAPIYPELEKLTLAFSLTKLREALGPDHPFVRKALDRKTPAQVAAETVDGTKLADVAFRERLLAGTATAEELANDPMIAFARTLDTDLRAARKTREDEINAPLTKAAAVIAAERFRILGTSVYPDATFTLRLSYGSVKGYTQNAHAVPAFTTFRGLYDRWTGAAPYDLPQRWLDAKDRLNLDQPFNFVTTNDIIGGNSGSPVINRDAQIVGLIFDGNRQSLGGDYGYDGTANRAVAVNAGAMIEALRVVYGANRIADELTKR